MLKIEWLFDNVTVIRSPDRVEYDISEANLDAVWPIQAVFVAGEQVYDADTPSWAQITLFRAI